MKFMTMDQIVQSVATIERNAGTLQSRIHRTAVSLLKLVHDKKIKPADAAPIMTNIQKASPYHANAFSQWVALKTPFLWADETKTWYAAPDFEFKGKAFMAARDEPFWEVSPPKEAKPIDLMADIQRLIDKAVKRTERDEGLVEGDNIPMDVIRQLRSVVADHKEAQVDH